MTYNLKKRIDSLGKRMSKEESVIFSCEIVFDTQKAAAAIDQLRHGNPKEIFNVLWALRNLQDTQLQAFPDLTEIILGLFQKFPKDEAILRDGVGLLQVVDISEDFQGEVFQVCFGFLQDSSKSIAVKVFSMTVCYNLAKNHLELLKELEMQIKDILWFQGDLSPAIFSRGNAILQKINRRLRK
jgi:hypothetical protein